MQAPLKCDKCGNEHEVIHERMGLNLATFRHEALFVCHYGSDFDGDVYTIVRDEAPQANALCDGCVGEMKQSGALVFERNYLQNFRNADLPQ